MVFLFEKEVIVFADLNSSLRIQQSELPQQHCTAGLATWGPATEVPTAAAQHS
jgi:hypothetical protein